MYGEEDPSRLGVRHGSLGIRMLYIAICGCHIKMTLQQDASVLVMFALFFVKPYNEILTQNTKRIPHLTP